MGHGVTWLSFLPGYAQFQDYLREATHNASLFGNAVLVQHVIAAALVVIVVFIVAAKAGYDIRKAGDDAIIPPPEPSLRNFLEVALEWLYKQAHQIIGKDADRYFPVIGTLALFIFFSNILGLVPGFAPPTDNWNTTAACALFVWLYFNYHGLRVNGWRYIAHMANPAGTWWGWFLMPLLFPIELVSTLIARPFSLTVRLAANMMGDHAVLAAFLGLVPILVPLPFLLLGLLVCVVQTLVFVLLTTIYISLSVAESHHDEHEEEEEAHAHA